MKEEEINNKIKERIKERFGNNITECRYLVEKNIYMPVYPEDDERKNSVMSGGWYYDPQKDCFGIIDFLDYCDYTGDKKIIRL